MTYRKASTVWFEDRRPHFPPMKKHKWQLHFPPLTQSSESVLDDQRPDSMKEKLLTCVIRALQSENYWEKETLESFEKEQDRKLTVTSFFNMLAAGRSCVPFLFWVDFQAQLANILRVQLFSWEYCVFLFTMCDR